MDPARRPRKSAPVKNAVFVGAMHKGRTKSRVGYNQNVEPVTSPIVAPANTGQSLAKGFGRVSAEDINLRQSRNSLPSSSSMRMSTPVRNSDSSPRYRTRHRSKQDNDSEHDRSRSILSSAGRRRKFHPDYDPMIEIRRAKERLSRYQTQDDWQIDMLLCDDCDEDLNRYEEKLKRRFTERGEPIESIQLERRQMELLRRQRDIDVGKVTDRYAEYILSTPKPERERYHPRTPNKFRKVSRRAWDGMIRKWRKHLHNFDDLNFEESWRSLSTVDVSLASASFAAGLSDTSDCENKPPISDKPDVDGSSAGLTASPFVKLFGKGKPEGRGKNFQVPQLKIEDDEDTLQAQPQMFKVDDPVKSTSMRHKSGGTDDEDTLTAMPKLVTAAGDNISRTTRGSTKRYSSGPAPDDVHSGLTNDMCYLGHKRSSGHLTKGSQKSDVDISDLSSFPKLQSNAAPMASPSKRIKRGILSQSGILGPDNRFHSNR